MPRRDDDGIAWVSALEYGADDHVRRKDSGRNIFERVHDEIDVVAVEFDFEFFGEQTFIADVGERIEEILVADRLDFDHFVFDVRVELVQLLDHTKHTHTALKVPRCQRQRQPYLSVWTSASSLCRVPILYFDLSGTYCIITVYSPEIMSNSGDSLSRRTAESTSALAFYTRHSLQCCFRARKTSKGMKYRCT